MDVRTDDDALPDHADVVVLGSGCAGLTAAATAAGHGAETVLLEKSDLLGGTTALSSGVLWLPDNPLAAAAGIEDSRAHAIAYLDSLSNGMILPALRDAFVDGVRPTLAWLTEHTPLRLDLVAGFPDYHPEHPGGRLTGRSVEPALFAVGRLGPWADRLVGTPRRMQVSRTPVGGGTGVLDPAEVDELERGGVEGLGRALVGMLLLGCLEAGVAVHAGCRALRVLTTDGSVSGVEVSTPGGAHVIRCRSVVIATGGFEQDETLVRSFLRGPLEHPPGVEGNTGDGLVMAMELGAQLGNMREAWWVPVVRVPDDSLPSGERSYLVNRERTLPGSVVVNGRGVRFTNEAANYNALGGAFHHVDPSSFGYPNVPAWLVFDAGMPRRYGVFGEGPGEAPSWVTTADSLGALAARIGLPAGALERTVERWNALVEQGHDDDFARGDSRYDGWFGDRAGYPGPASTMGAIAEPPFHAVRLHPSALGTSGGPRTTPDGVVLDVRGRPIGGLHACGNAMAAVTGMTYGGAGGTLGPALVTGFLAGRQAARR